MGAIQLRFKCRRSANPATPGGTLLTGSGYQNINISLIKNAQLAGHAALQIRAEATNLLDHPNFDLPDIFVGWPTFDRIQSVQSPRRL